MTSATLMREAASGVLGGISTIVGTPLTASGSTGTNHTTASITVAPGDLVFIYITAAVGAGNVGTIPTPVGASQTWLRPSALSARFPDLTPNNPRRGAIYYCIGTTGSGTIAINGFAGSTDCDWVITKFTGVDMTNPFVYANMLSTAANATSQKLYARKFLDATYNAGVAFCMSGNGGDSNVVGSGYTSLGHTNVPPTSLPSIMVEYKVGEDLVADWTWTNSASNWGWFYELRASGSAADQPITFYSIAKAATGSDGTTYTITAPVWAATDVIYLATLGERTTTDPIAHTVAGGGVTWVEATSAGGQLFNDGGTDKKRLQLFRAKGPLDGTNVVITCGQTQQGNCYWMFAMPGADLTGTNGSGSVVQTVLATATSTASASVTLAANASSRNGVVLVAASTVVSGSVRTVPSGGLVSVDHLDWLDTGDLTHGSPNETLSVHVMPYNATALSGTFNSAGNVAAIGVEVKAA